MITRTFLRTGILMVALASKSQMPAQDYNFTTLAGNAGFGSSDGLGSAARFYQPSGIAMDAAGNLFVADANNAMIRKLTPVGTNWSVTTIAGRAGRTGSADGVNGTARFNNPFGVVTGPGGNVFVMDANNHTVRKLAPAGADWVVSTIAGNAGNSGTNNGTNGAAGFNSPLAAAADGNGDLLVADTSNSTIRRLTPVGTNWAVTTIAGQPETPGDANGTNAAAQFSAPIGIAVGPGGDAFVADSGNHIIRKLSFVGTNCVVTTIAGLSGSPGASDGTNSNARFSGPTGVAVDLVGNVYVAEWGTSLIRKLAPVGTNWVVTTLAGSFGGYADGTNNTARFFQPYALAVGTNGAVFVADTANNLIRKLTAVGTNWVVTTIAGLAGGGGSVDGTNSAARFSDPYPGAFDIAGNLYIADSANSTIRKLAHVGADWVVTTIAGLPTWQGTEDGTNSQAHFRYPYALAADASGNLYVADTFNSTIRKVAPAGSDWVVTTIAGVGGFGGAGSTDGTNTEARFNAPFGLTTDASGKVFVADTSNNTIRKMTPDGTNWITTTIAGLAGFGNSGSNDGTNSIARFNGPQGVVVGGGGVLYVTDTSNNTLRKLTPQGTNWIVTTIAGVAGSFTSVDGTNSNARFAGPAGLAIDTSGNLYIADRGNALLRKATPIGTNWVVTTIGGATGIYGNADGIGTNAFFYGPNSLVVDGAGRLFIGDNNAIRLGEPVVPPVQGPSLKIFLAGDQAILSWPSWASNYALETTNALPGGLPWTLLGGATLSGTNYFKTNPVSGNAFFRLHQQ